MVAAMPVVTDITAQRRRKTRVNVFLDGEFWCGMDRLCQIELGLAPGAEVSEAGVKEMEHHISENDALVFCVDSLAMRARTEAQMATKLVDKGYSEAVVEATLARCRELLLLNDESYAHALASERKEGGQGRRRVAMKLQQDGVDRDLADQVLTEVFDAVDDETERAECALTQRFRAPLSRVEQRRALGFLLRRGFGSQAARDVVSTWAATEEAKEAGPSAQEAAVLLHRKYPKLNPRESSDIKRAQGFLVRRGCSFDVVREALTLLHD
jgi:regulatory protein